MRNDVDAEAVTRDLVHREAHAVDGDGPLARDVAREPRRQVDREHERARSGLDRGDAADAVHVAADQMAVERLAEGERRLEVHAVPGREPAERRDGERLGRDVRLEAVRADGRRRPAYAIDGDARERKTVGE